MTLVIANETTLIKLLLWGLNHAFLPLFKYPMCRIQLKLIVFCILLWYLPDPP